MTLILLFAGLAIGGIVFIAATLLGFYILLDALWGRLTRKKTVRDLMRRG